LNRYTKGGRTYTNQYMGLSAAFVLFAAISACGGGGGSTAPEVNSSGGGAGTASPGSPSTTTPAGNTSSLLSHLAQCPNALTINETVPCMVGQYSGKTIDTGVACTFVYDPDGVATYNVGTQTLRGSLNPGLAVTVFEKKPANNSAGFSIDWTVGSPSGGEVNVSYQLAKEPAGAGGMLIKPKNGGVPTCLVQSGPAVPATGGGSTANLLSRSWQTPQLLNGGNGALGLLADQAAFDAGMAEDGRAFITYRQPDAAGRMAVFVVEGRPGAAGQNPAWSLPLVLDGDAPLLAGNFRPRIAVSSNGHAVVTWLTQRPCEADAVYETNPAGKTCRYFYASRRLATDAAWEAPKRVKASPTMVSQDHFARINAQGDVLLAFPSFNPLFVGSSGITSSTLAVRLVTSAEYRSVGLSGFWSNPIDTTAFADRIHADLDDANNIFVAGEASGAFDVSQLRTTATDAVASSYGNKLPVVSLDGTQVYELRRGASGFAAHTWRNSEGSKRNPAKLSVYSPVTQAWLATYDIRAYTQWGDTTLVGTDHPEGEFLLYSGCKLTAWRSGAWTATRDLPPFCGRDQLGGVYAFNRKGDYLGINWAGKPGQWGYFSYAQNKMLKGAPGDGPSAAGDYVLGTPSTAFGSQPTQLLLTSNGLGLAVTSNAYTSLPSSANPAGVSAGTAGRLWALYLK